MRESSLLASKSGVQFETRDPATNNKMNSEDSHHIQACPQLLYMHHGMYMPELLHTNTHTHKKILKYQFYFFKTESCTNSYVEYLEILILLSLPSSARIVGMLDEVLGND